MAKNVYKLPKHVWKMFGKKGQAMFNHMYRELHTNDLKLVYGCEGLNLKQLRVVRWNMAWVAARIARDC
jgi:hypothetical protein